MNYASTSAEIKRMYVHPTTFGTGLSDILIKKIIEWMQEKGYCDNIFLGVYSDNLRAQKFYNRYGFEKIGEYGFVVGDVVDREFICHWKGFKTSTEK